MLQCFLICIFIHKLVLDCKVDRDVNKQETLDLLNDNKKNIATQEFTSNKKRVNTLRQDCHSFTILNIHIKIACFNICIVLFLQKRGFGPTEFKNFKRSHILQYLHWTEFRQLFRSDILHFTSNAVVSIWIRYGNLYYAYKLFAIYRRRYRVISMTCFVFYLYKNQHC